MDTALKKVLEARAAIRAALAEQRAQLSEKQWLERSQKIFDVLKADDALQRAKVVHCFISMPKRREVNTEPILQWLQAQGKEIAVPVMKSRNLVSVRFLGMDKLATGVFEVLEPTEHITIDESTLMWCSRHF